MPNNIDKIRKALLNAKRGKADITPKDAETMNTIGRDLVNAITPALAKIMEETRVSKDSLVKDIQEALKEIKIDVPQSQITANIPDIIIPDIKVPEARVNIPPIRIPEVVMPKEMDVRGWVKLQGVDLNNPLPVQLRDAKGNPLNLLENLTTVISQGGGGGAAKIVKISDINASAFAFTNPDGRVKVELPSGSTGLTDAELRASSVPVEQVSGSVWSVYATNPYGQGDSTNSLRVIQAGDSISSVSVKEIFATAAADMVNPDNRLRVSLETGASGLTDAELRASSILVEQVSGSIWSVYVTRVTPGTGATDLGKAEDSGHTSGDVGVMALGVRNEGNDDFSGTDKDYVPISTNAKGNVFVKNAPDGFTVSGVTNSVAASIVDSTGVQYSGSNPLPISDAGGSLTVDGTVAVSGITNSVAAALINSSGVQYSGSNPVPVSGSVSVSGSTGTVGANIVDSSGVAYTTANPLPIGDAGGAITVDGTVAVSGITNSVAASIIDSSGIGYSGSNPLPTTVISGALTSVVAVGDIPSDAADTGSAPIKIGGIARTTNPSAVSDGDRITVTLDDIGRQIVRPVQVRDLISTAYVSKATGSTFGTETTLLASGSNTFLDLIYVMGTNDSTAAIQCDFRASTGGTVLMSVEIPAGGTAGIACPVPIPAPFSDHTWTIDLPDVTGTNVTITALFTKEV